eukprot:7390635-Prymnesium_polylepis.1
MIPCSCLATSSRPRCRSSSRARAARSLSSAAVSSAVSSASFCRDSWYDTSRLEIAPSLARRERLHRRASAPRIARLVQGCFLGDESVALREEVVSQPEAVSVIAGVIATTAAVAVAAAATAAAAAAAAAASVAAAMRGGPFEQSEQLQ